MAKQFVFWGDGFKKTLEILYEVCWTTGWICGIVYVFHGSRSFPTWLGRKLISNPCIKQEGIRENEGGKQSYRVEKGRRQERKKKKRWEEKYMDIEGA